MGCSGENSHHQSEESCNGMYDEDCRKSRSSCGREIETVLVLLIEQTRYVLSAYLLEISISSISPVLYPTSMGLHPVARQYPKTPKSTPPYDPNGICLMMGVEITEIRSNANAANNKIVNGVAGLNILKYMDVLVKRR